MRRNSLLPILVLLAAASVRAAPDVDLPKELPDEPFEFTAGAISFSNSTFVADGGVTGRYEHIVLTADRATGNSETGDLVLDGDIHVERGPVIWDGTRLEYNYKTDTGTFGPSALEFEPVLMSVDHVERVSTNEYLLRGATFTTCGKDHPHYHIRANEATLLDEKYLKAKGVAVYLGDVPVLYVPYWRQKLEKGIFTFKFGFGSEWGAYSLINATVPVRDWLEWSTDANIYSRRGLGLGQGLAWNRPNMQGGIEAFYIKDQDPLAKYDSAAARQLIDSNRYRLKFDQLHRFSDTFYLSTEWNYLSDPAVLEEFFKSEYRQNAQPENYASLVYGNRHIGTEAFVNKRLNDFYDNTDRLEYSLDLYRTRLGNSPLYLQSENAVAGLERVYAEPNPAAGNYDAGRFDSMNTLSLPRRLAFLSVTPRATYRVTHYTKSSTTSGGAETRHIPGAGLEASFQATKILSDRARWYGSGLRHKIEPYADYIYQDASVGPDRLLRFDEVDELRDENKVRLGLRNVLQTRRGNRVARFIDLDLYTHYLIEDHGTGNSADSLFVDARMPLTERWMVDVEGEWDWNAGEVPFFDTRLSYDRDDVVLGLEHLYQEGIQSLWTPRFDLFPEEKYSFEGFARFNDRHSDLEEVALVAYMNHCCMRYGIGYHFYDDNEHRLMFSIGLSAFPEARIKSSL